MSSWEIVALPQGDEIMKNGRVADTAEAERILNKHERLVEALRRLVASSADFVECQKSPELGAPDLEWAQEIEDKARALLAELDAGGQGHDPN